MVLLLEEGLGHMNPLVPMAGCFSLMVCIPDDSEATSTIEIGHSFMNCTMGPGANVQRNTGAGLHWFA